MVIKTGTCEGSSKFRIISYMSRYLDAFPCQVYHNFNFRIMNGSKRTETKESRRLRFQDFQEIGT